MKFNYRPKDPKKPSHSFLTDGVEVAVQSVPLVLILVPAALEIHGAADGDQKDGQEEDPNAESGLRRRHFRGG